jgi:DNA-binding response OmpR family regulator
MKCTLLIAEGDAELCEVYRRFFTERGYEVETASDGLDCLAKLRRATPAALVLDRELRWGGGDGVLAWLREQSEAFTLPVVLTTTATLFSGAVSRHQAARYQVSAQALWADGPAGECACRRRP